MRGGESFVSVFRQVFKLLTVNELNLTKLDIEDMPPFERYVYFDLVEEFREEVEKQRKEEEAKQ